MTVEAFERLTEPEKRRVLRNRKNALKTRGRRQQRIAELRVANLCLEASIRLKERQIELIRLLYGVRAAAQPLRLGALHAEELSLSGLAMAMAHSSSAAELTSTRSSRSTPRSAGVEPEFSLAELMALPLSPRGASRSLRSSRSSSRAVRLRRAR
jgi:hypothetical protein